jgi:tRNA (guanine37-N1)-methyltransferase
VLDKNKPRIRTVVNKTDAIHSKYRTMQLELLAGNSSLVTTVVEHGLSFRLDLASVYVPLIPVHSIWSLVIMFVIPCYQILLTPCPVLVDSYWNSRLATERQRLITSFDPNDIVCKCYICTCQLWRKNDCHSFALFYASFVLLSPQLFLEPCS